MARTKGTKQLVAEVAESLVDELRAFAAGRGETIRAVIEAALRRHMDNPPALVPPPPPVYPPLPPVPAPAPPVARAKKK